MKQERWPAKAVLMLTVECIGVAVDLCLRDCRYRISLSGIQLVN